MQPSEEHCEGGKKYRGFTTRCKQVICDLKHTIIWKTVKQDRINYIISSLSTVLTGWCLQLKDKLKHILKAIQTLLKVMKWTTAMAKSITYLQYSKARKTLKQLETT